MSATILGGDITIYYLDDNRQKRLEWSGTATGTRSINEVYSACADLLDEVGQMDDGTVMSAETPVEYTIGKIDAGDNDPWYISYDCMEHITGGALKTSGWARVETSNTGIIIVPVTSAGRTIVTADIGYTITSDTDNDSGTLLDIIDVGDTNDYLVIRPDTSASGNSFDNSPTSGDGLTSSRGAYTATQAAASTTGEQIWANFYSVTPIESDTHLYIYQGLVSDATRARIPSITDSTQDWWSEGAFDRCIFIRDYKTDGNPIIDGGYVTAFVRKGNTLYDSFELQASNTSGGRNPVPLSASNDLNQTTGYASITFTASSGNWSVGDEISGDSSGARGIITQIDSPGSTQTVHYYYIGDPQTPFSSGIENLTNEDDSGTGTKDGSAPANQGPALSTWFTNNSAPSISFGNQNYDIDNDTVAEGWGIDIDCNNNPLTEVYEWLKYITRNGETGTTNTDGIEGEQYEGGTVFIDYGTSAVSGGTIVEGDEVTQETSGASGIVISHNTTDKEMLLRNTRGTFTTGSATDHTITSTNNSGAVEMDTSDNAIATTFTASKSSPFGTFAGGTFFGARGVLLSNWLSADENSFQLIDVSGTVRSRPTAFSIEVSNLVGTDETTITDDRVAVFRLTSSAGPIDKTEHSCAGGESIGDETITVDSAIPQDVPGKTTGGILRIRDNSDSNKEYRLRFASWTGSVFTLATLSPTAFGGGTNTTTIVRTTGDDFSTAKRGDLVYNTTQAAVSYVVSVDDANTVTIDPPISGQSSTDTIELNTLPIALDTADDLYVPLMDRYAASATESVSLVYNAAEIFYKVVVRNVAATTKIKPFATTGSSTGTDKAIPTIRTEDTIYS